MNVMNEDLEQLSELIFRLSPYTYETSLQFYNERVTTHKGEILEVLLQVLSNIPGCFIQLTFILDLSEENEIFFNEIRDVINEWLKTTVNHNNLIILFVNLYFLSKYKFILMSSYEKLVELNDLNIILDLITPANVASRQIIQTSRNNDLNRNIVMDEFLLPQDVTGRVRDHLQNLKEKSILEFNGDMMVAYHIIDTFLFDKVECGINLTIYFIDYEFTNLIYGVFLYYLANKDKRGFIIALFMSLTKTEGFLPSFYNLYEYLIKVPEIKELITLLMAFIYERYFYPETECISYYKTSTEHDPSLCNDERTRFFEILSPESVEILLRISNHEELKYQLRSEQKKMVPRYNVFKEKELFDLKTLINARDLSKIKEYPKEDFFRTFLIISRYSVSHFLVHLEILKEYFILSWDEQRVFCAIIKELFTENSSFRRIVCNKLAEYKIINDVVGNEFPGLFHD